MAKLVQKPNKFASINKLGWVWIIYNLMQFWEAINSNYNTQSSHTFILKLLYMIYILVYTGCPNMIYILVYTGCPTSPRVAYFFKSKSLFSWLIRKLKKLYKANRWICIQKILEYYVRILTWRLRDFLLWYGTLSLYIDYKFNLNKFTIKYCRKNIKILTHLKIVIFFS